MTTKKTELEETEEDVGLLEEVKNWVEELSDFARLSRKQGRTTQEPILFSEILPRMKALGQLLAATIEEGALLPDELEQPGAQFVEVRATTAAAIRSYFMDRGPFDPYCTPLFIQLEADLSGQKEQDVASQIMELQATMQAEQEAHQKAQQEAQQKAQEEEKGAPHG